MSDQTAATLTVELRPAQHAAYLHDFEHHAESDDADYAALYDVIAGAALVTLTDEEGTRRRRHVLTLTRAQACDLLALVEMAIMLTDDADEREDPQAKTRMRHHEAAWITVRAAGAETVTEFNQRTARQQAGAEQAADEKPTPAGQYRATDGPTPYTGDPYALPVMVRASRRTEALHGRTHVELSVRRDPAAGWVLHLDADDVEADLYSTEAAAMRDYERRVWACEEDYARDGQHAWTQCDVPGVPLAPGLNPGH